MANRYATKTGAWSDVTVWDGGTTLPQSGDTVRPNTFTVTIDQDVDVTELRFDAAAPAAANGVFLVSSIPGGGRTIDADVSGTGYAGSATTLLSVTATSGTLTINGDVNAGIIATGSVGLVGVTGVGVTVVINGDVTGPNNAAATNIASGVRQNATGSTVTINGNVTGGAGSGNGRKPGVHVTVGTVNVVGNVAAGPVTANTAHGIYADSASSVVVVTGNVSGGPATTAAGIDVAAGGSITVNGDVSAGVTGNGINVIAGNAPTIDVDGVITATTAAHGILASTATLVRARTQIDGSNGRAAVVAPVIVTAESPVKSSWTIRGDAGFPTIGSAIVLANFEDNGLPNPADVRLGTTYGANDELEGTLPAPVTPADVWDYLTADADTVGSMGARLRDAATVATVGAQLAAALDVD